MPLQHLDLVAVRILYEEEAGHQCAVAMEFLDRCRIQAELGEPPVLTVQIADRQRQMAVAAAV